MSKKILVIEDDNALYSLYATELGLKNYEVSHVSDGALAMDAIKKEMPDLILLDLMLPGKSGLQILEEMRSDKGCSHLKVIILTNFGTEEQVKKAIELGAEEYIMKYNIVPSDLSAKVAVILGDTQDPVVKVTNYSE